MPGSAGGAWAADISIGSLMTMMSQVRESRAVFREEKTMAALNAPLESQGTLHYVAPAKLEKHTTAPNEELLAVDGDQLTLAKPAEKMRQTLRLDQQPEIRAFVESIRGTLAGDLPTLERYYSVGLDGTSDKWRLTLVPLSSRARDYLKVIRIEGSGPAIRRFESVEAGGDSSSMTIEPAS